MIILGIVGSIAGGKSTVASRLQHLGAVWVNADSIARQALDRSSVREELVDHFGESILDSVGQIDRSKIGAIVFGNDQASQLELRYLESVVHPVVREQISETLRQNEQAGVQVSLLDVPLLFESGWDRSCDGIWCIDADPKLRAERAVMRGWHSDEITKRELRQLPIQVKKQLSNRVIHNNGTIEQLHQTIDQHWKLLALANKKQSSDSHCQ